MTENEFNLGLIADPIRTADGRTRVRYLVMEGFERRASELRRAGRPDRAGLCNYIASQLRGGRPPSKRAVRKAAREVREVEAALVDGVGVTGLLRRGDS